VIAEVGWDHPDAVALRAMQRADIAVVYGRDDSEPAGSEATGADVFVVAYRDGAPVACGGLRAIGDGIVEVKRMYATPAARGTGAAVAVIRALEAWAVARGFAAVRLETGDRLVAAQRFYLREGYSPIARYGPYVDSELSLCFEKRLTPAE
jgi:GNAT superfamily N-acetyltransferase